MGKSDNYAYYRCSHEKHALSESGIFPEYVISWLLILRGQIFLRSHVVDLCTDEVDV